jgi:hypothetical protein
MRGRRGSDPRSRSGLSKAESERERLLLRRLDRPRAVVGTNPSDRFRGRKADEDRQAREGRSGPSVTTDAAELDAFAGPSPLEHRDKHIPGSIWLSRDSEVGPVEMVVGPRRLPPRVQVEPVIGRFITPIRVGRVKGNRNQFSPVRQRDHRPVSVAVQFAEPVLMTRFLAQREVVVPEPPKMTFGAEHLIVSFGSVHVLSIPQVVRAFSITHRRAANAERATR